MGVDLPSLERVGSLDHLLDRVKPFMRGPTLPIAILVRLDLGEVGVLAYGDSVVHAFSVP
jgi:hypothetical protein